MSEQDKRAEEVLVAVALKLATSNSEDVAGATSIIAAALAQARQEGVKSMLLYCEELKADRADCYREGVEAFRDLAIADWSAGVVYSRGTAKTWLTGLAVRLAKGGTDG